MIVVLSPSKTLDMTPALPPVPVTLPDLLDETKALAAILKKKSAAELGRLMTISPKLSVLNRERFQSFRLPYPKGEGKAALLAFRGDVYTPMPVADYSKADWRQAEKSLRILSGFYGLLRPADAILAYRLEMGTSLPTKRGEDLYDFWGDHITRALNDALADSGGPLINCASQEYFKAVDRRAISAPILDIAFKEQKNNAPPKIIALFAKKARGMMADYVIRERATTADALKDFTTGGYRYAKALSSGNEYVFLRKTKA